ncbi:bifunctional demethylmenaquinone methyltransferase/2-methoxy-6-polyprenyl-1,4-benzoquinol methylase UbiE [Melioribacteraceae bacterium 4301-Me]|uniref:bifunctional demethylmenaquinone methyltransferase/2-methoxy-6-polyprenyl-1,4-benzoquinol methylase UbiE n=1 Tax=Pyranulibacter aquaticus TaxID=3163344 RepID=UPI00359641F2
MSSDKKNKVKRIFDSISDKYDFLNHFLSAGIDFYWRRKALKLSNINNSSIILDVACGTGDFSIAAKKLGAKRIFGADLSLNMLKLFNKKADWSKGNIVQSVAETLPFKRESFTNVIVAFGVRNFYDIEKAFNQFYKVLKPYGKVTVLEFRLPVKSIIKYVYSFYFNKILPFIGKVISKDKEAYTYLPESVNEFEQNINLTELFRKANFKKMEVYSLTFGIVQVIIAEK